MSPQDQQVFALLAARIREHFPEAHIWAYGSRARGESTADSDFDICVILPEISDNAEKIIRRIAWEIGFEHEYLITTLVFSQNEFDKGLISYSPLVANIRKDGIAA